MAKSDLRIDILGTSIAISTDEEAEYLEKLLAKYRENIEKVRQKSGLKDPLKIAVLTGFLICHDLEKAGTAVSGEDGEAERLTQGMISSLDELAKGISKISATEDAEFHQEDNDAKTHEFSAHKLSNTVKHYAWGSAEWIPALLGQENTSRVPWAELWMGVHPAGPSRIAAEGFDGPLLSDLIEKDPLAFLGRECAKKFGKLPFLFKVLAAARPLSIQAHPSGGQAREGFERENREGIPLDSASRNYRDASHKPEIICALSPFAALCGFRKADEICFLMEILRDCAKGNAPGIDQGNVPGNAPVEGALNAYLESLVSALSSPPGQGQENPLRAFLAALLLRSEGSLASEALGPFMKAHAQALEKDFPEYRDEWKLCSYLAGLYPNDPGILAPLYLNIMELAPGEAMYLPSGVLHAYLHGMGIELMADSDNVLRGGLTKKHVDPEELLKTLSFSAYRPEIMKAPSPAPSWFSYPSPAGEFLLSAMQCSGTGIEFPETGPSILLISNGTAVMTDTLNKSETVLSKGESAFILAGNNRLEFNGTFTAYVASCRS